MITKAPVARGIPFDNTGTLLTSTDVRAAILEVLNSGFDASKAFLLAQYNGNANAGRYLEFFTGISSDTAPIFVPNAYKGITIVARATSTATCVLRFADLQTGSPVTLYDVTFTAQDQVIATGTPASPLFTTLATAKLAVYVLSGSITKPHLYIVGQGG